MQPADERILELLASDSGLQPKTINHKISEKASALDYHDEHIGRRCRKLAEMGLLNKTGAGVYSITELGREFLDGMIDADDLEGG